MRRRFRNPTAPYFVVVLSPDDRLYDWRLLNPGASKGDRFRTLKGPLAVKVGDTYYDLDRSMAVPMYGWDPRLRRTWLSDIWNATARGTVRLLLYTQGDPKPLDRILTKRGALEVTPEIQRTLNRESLLKRHQARLSFGSGASSKVLLVILIVLVAAVLLFYLGGSNG